EKNKTILFTSAYRREGSTMVAFQAARAAANQSAGRVLYVHISEHLPRFFRDIHVKIPLSLDDYINKEGGDVLPFVVLDKSGLVCAWFRGPGEGVSPENLKALISSLRK